MQHLRDHLMAVYERKGGGDGEPDGAGDLGVPLEEFWHVTGLVRGIPAAATCSLAAASGKGSVLFPADLLEWAAPCQCSLGWQKEQVTLVPSLSRVCTPSAGGLIRLQLPGQGWAGAARAAAPPGPHQPPWGRQQLDHAGRGRHSIRCDRHQRH